MCLLEMYADNWELPTVIAFMQGFLLKQEDINATDESLDT